MLGKINYKLVLLLILLAALSIYLAIEGFANYSSYLQYMQNKYGTSSLCDPCYDPDCKTKYPLDQSECSPSASIPLPKYNPNEFSPYRTGTSLPNTNIQTRTPILPKGGSSNTNDADIEKLIKIIEPKIVDNVKGTIKKEMASKDAVMNGSKGSLKMDTLPNPAQAPAKPNDCSPAAAQGADYSAGCKPFNINEWIRKDSIPCYGCTLPA
jgi:hypothetical protein